MLRVVDVFLFWHEFLFLLFSFVILLGERCGASLSAMPAAGMPVGLSDRVCSILQVSMKRGVKGGDLNTCMLQII